MNLLNVLDFFFFEKTKKQKTKENKTKQDLQTPKHLIN